MVVHTSRNREKAPLPAFYSTCVKACRRL
jgi:hypothetical protein